MKKNEDFHLLIKEIMKSIIGDTTQTGFSNFVNKSWHTGNFLYHLNSRYHSDMYLINSLDKNEKFLTQLFYLPHQVPSTSTLIYKEELYARLVHDSFNDKGAINIKFNEFNIEPHYHIVDSMIIVTSQHKNKPGKYFIHDKKLGFDTIIEVPLVFGSIVCFPRNVSHTFLPSDSGLSTLNITNAYIQPHTKGFSYPAPCDFNDAVIMTYDNYHMSLNKILYTLKKFD